jgi:hypothetical protein
MRPSSPTVSRYEASAIPITLIDAAERLLDVCWTGIAATFDVIDGRSIASLHRSV